MRRVIFYHIPKCAGTSVRKVLTDSYPEKEVCPFVTRDLHIRGEPELREYNVFSGSYTPPKARNQIGGNFIEAILLRNPMDRLVSLYQWCGRVEDQGVKTGWPFLPFESAQKYSFEEFLSLERKRLTNSMCKQIVGATGCSLDLAARAYLIICSMDVVGVVEHGLGDFLWNLSESAELKWDGEIPWENMSSDGSIEITPKAQVLLKEITHGDLLVYNTVKEYYYDACV